MCNIVNKHPWNDICSVIWVISFLGWLEIGRTHFWVVIINLGIAALLRKFIQAKRPVEYDLSFQPMTDRGALSYAFPSLESYMSVVILGHIGAHLSNVALLVWTPFSIGLTFVIGASRLYAKSRFPHQIIGSWVLGVVGLVAVMHLCERHQVHLWERFVHSSWVGFAITCLLTNFAIAMESNDSILAYTPRQEFIRVIGGIVNGSSEQNGEGTPGEPSQTPRSAALAAARANATIDPYGNKNMSNVKRDSFYFLQKTLEKREDEKKGLIRRSNGVVSSETDTPRSVSSRGSRKDLFRGLSGSRQVQFMERTRTENMT